VRLALRKERTHSVGNGCHCRAAQLWSKLLDVGAYAFGEDEFGDILEDLGFATVRTKNVGMFQWVRGKRG
jgi:arsenite methyltransferase